jgi:hypothetical protein
MRKHLIWHNFLTQDWKLAMKGSSLYAPPDDQYKY